MTETRLFLHRIDAPMPLGPILIAADDRAVVAIEFDDTEERLQRLLIARYGAARSFELGDPHGAETALRGYLDGNVTEFAGLPVDGGGTPFQRLVWEALRAIPFGETRSYGQIAATIGQPGAARAVGLANGRNPVSIVVPCHRVIGSSGALTGYGGGLDRKRWLLAHERRQLSLFAPHGQRPGHQLSRLTGTK